MGIFNIELSRFVVFNMVAREGNLSVAADKLFLTEPTVNYHLKALEKAFGVKLYHIKNQRVILTKMGQDLFQYTNEIWDQLNKIEKLLYASGNNHIRVGVTPMLNNIVSAALSKILKIHPDIDVEIVSSIGKTIISQVSDLEFDVGVIMTDDYSKHKVLPTRVSDKERLGFMVSYDNPLTARKIVNWFDLVEFPLICGPHGSLTRVLVIDGFQRAGIRTQPHFILDTLSIEILKLFVMEHKAVGLWHTKDIEKDVAEGKLKILPFSEELLAQIDVIVSPESKLKQPIIKDIIHAIKHEFS